MGGSLNEKKSSISQIHRCTYIERQTATKLDGFVREMTMNGGRK